MACARAPSQGIPQCENFPLPKIDFEELRGLEGVRSTTIDVDGLKLNIGIAHGLHNARKLLEDIKAGKSQFHAIEIMACPGGIAGGIVDEYRNME